LCGPHDKLTIPELGDRSYQVDRLWDISKNSSDPNVSCIVQQRFQSADIMWSNRSSGAASIWKIPNGNFYAGTNLGGADTAWQVVGSGDVNGDGTSDLVWWNKTSGSVVVWFVANGGYAGAATVGGASLDWNIRAVADISGDGIADLVWFNTVTGEVFTWLLDGYGYPVGFASLGYSTGGWVPRGSGDFNGDGMNDLFFTYTSSGVQHVGIWLLNGTSVLAYMTYPTDPVLSQSSGQEKTIVPEASFSGVGDFNGDGLSDIVWQIGTGTGPTSIAIWTLTARSCPGTNPVCVQQGVSLGSATAGYEVNAVADVNGDNVSDLIFRHAATGDIYTWLTVWGPQPGIAAVHTGGASLDWSIATSGFFDIYPQVW
jgi:hypothetical protein